MTDPMDPLHDDLSPEGDGAPILPSHSPPTEAPGASHFQPFFSRHHFELFAAGMALSGVRSPKDTDKIFLRAEALADHYEARGFFDGGDPLRLDQHPDFGQEEDPMQAQPMTPPHNRTRDGKNVRVVGEGLPSRGVEPKQYAQQQNRPAVTVGGKRQPTQFVGRSTVNATNGSHRPGSSTQVGPVQVQRRPPPRPMR